MARRPMNMKIKFVRALAERQEVVMKSLSNDKWLLLDVEKISNKNWEWISELFTFVDIPIDKRAIDEWIKPDKFKKKNE
jgi:hypothetical protein